MRGGLFIIVCLILTVSSLCGEVDLLIQLAPEIDPVGIEVNGLGMIFIQDASGAIFALSESGEIVAQLEAVSPEIVKVSDIAASAGGLLLADREGAALFVTDWLLRRPTKLSLTIRPSKIAVSSDGRMLVYDQDRRAVFLFTGWRDTKPIELLLPDIENTGEVVSLFFDRLEKQFFIVTEKKFYQYSIFGAYINEIEICILPNPVAAFTTPRGLEIFGKDSGLIFADSALTTINFSTKILTAAQDISGRILLLTKTSILRIESQVDIGAKN